MPIMLMPLTNTVSPGDVKSLSPSSVVYACDFYIDEIEKHGVEVTGGYQYDSVINIDHHAPVARMSRLVSSTNLAIDHVKSHGVPGRDAVVAINHTDCDNVLSAAIISGMLPPDDDLGIAALAADHTGAECPLADMLMGVQHLRAFDFSLHNACLLRDGKSPDPMAIKGLEDRRQRREDAAKLLYRAVKVGSLAYVRSDKDTDSELFPSLMPDVALFLIAVPSTEKAGHVIMKLRLGMAAPKGLTLQCLNIREFDPMFGGRWNAGANKRGGGTAMSVESYAEELNRRLQDFTKV